jgi:hypothetical protein
MGINRARVASPATERSERREPQRVRAHFEGIHFRLSTTDVHVVAGDAGVFASNIDSVIRAARSS